VAAKLKCESVPNALTQFGDSQFCYRRSQLQNAKNFAREQTTSSTLNFHPIRSPSIGMCLTRYVCMNYSARANGVPVAAWTRNKQKSMRVARRNYATTIAQDITS
jgi:hypothetical protein